MTDCIDPRLARRLEGRCCYGACPERAIDGSDYCAPHDAHERGRDAAKKRRRRLQRAQLGLCAEGCGRKVGKRRTKHGHVTLVRCIECANAHRDRQRERCVPDESAGVPDNAPRTKLEVQPDGYTRVRTTGRGTKAVTAENRHDNRDDEFGWAIDDLVLARKAHAKLRSEAILSLPRIQKEEAHKQVTDLIKKVQRLCGSLAAQVHAGRAAEIDREIREALEADAEID